MQRGGQAMQQHPLPFPYWRDLIERTCGVDRWRVRRIPRACQSLGPCDAVRASCNRCESFNCRQPSSLPGSSLDGDAKKKAARSLIPPDAIYYRTISSGHSRLSANRAPPPPHTGPTFAPVVHAPVEMNSLGRACVLYASA